MNTLDRRLNAFRPDLADEELAGKVDAPCLVAGRPASVAVPVLDMKSAPRPDAGLDTQLLAGDEVRVFEEAEGYAWVQARRDRYVGYVSAAGLEHDAPATTHVVTAPRTFSYREPDMKKQATACYSMGDSLRIVATASTRGTDFALLESGEAIIANHLRPHGSHAVDYVAIAEQLEHTPYLWGGKSAFGIDCSGLVQLSMRMAGTDVLRDTDMQAATIGWELDVPDDLSGLQRGDLIFWKGHVAIMLDATSIIHANGHAMMVSREPLRDAVDRVAYLYGRPTVFRRP
jgi:cell wall-associated NlpC family hydrolase